MKIAKFMLSPPLFLNVLSLPEDTNILSIRFDSVEGDADISVIVEHKELKQVSGDAVAEERIPAALPKFTRDAEGVKFVGWGQE